MHPAEHAEIELSDAELAGAWQAGAAGALDAVYRRHAPALFGTAVGLVGEPSGAGDVVHDTFLRAATRISTLRDPSRLRAWLFAILRNEAVSWHRARARVASGLDDGPVPVTEWAADDAPPADVEVSRRELSELVWTAAEGLQPRDREVLELHLRGGLEAGDLARVLGVTPGHAAVLLSRMRDRLERCLGAVLIARAGRADCPGLDRVLDGWDGRFSLAVRGSVVRHVESCTACSHRRERLTSLEHLAPVIVPPMVVLPEELHVRLVSALTQLTTQPAAAAVGIPDGSALAEPAIGDGEDSWAWHEDGFPRAYQLPDDSVLPDDTVEGVPLHPVAVPPPGPPIQRDDRRRHLARRAGAAAVIAMLFLLGGLWWAVLRPAGDQATVVLPASGASVLGFPPGTDSGTSTAAPSAGPTGSLPAGTGTALPTGPVPAGTDDEASGQGPAQPSGGTAGEPTPSGTGPTTTPSPTTPRPTTGTTSTIGTTITTSTSTTTTDRPPPTPSRPAPSTPPAPPRILRAVVSPSVVMTAGCQPELTTLSVAVSASGPVSGTVQWAPPGGSLSTKDLAPAGGSTLTAVLGTFDKAGTLTLRVRVTDSAGGVDTASTTLTVATCLALG